VPGPSPSPALVKQTISDELPIEPDEAVLLSTLHLSHAVRHGPDLVIGLGQLAPLDIDQEPLPIALDPTPSLEEGQQLTRLDGELDRAIGPDVRILALHHHDRQPV